MTAQATLPPIVIDFETYFTKGYSVTDLGVISYVKDPQFEVIGFGYKELNQEAKWHTGDKTYLALMLAGLKLSERTVIAHNAMFDGAILEWYFGIKPAQYYCTMMAARPYVIPFRGSASLEACAEFYKIGYKGDEAKRVQGLHRQDFTIEGLQTYGEYCRNDCVLAAQLYLCTRASLPDDEQTLIDLTIKKFTRPRLEIDRPLVQAALEEHETETAKGMLLANAAGASKLDLNSNAKFAAALLRLGVVLPSTTNAKGQATYTFSKKDPAFMKLQSHPDQRVRHLVQARLMAKSTIGRTRLEAFDKVAGLMGKMPVPLMYYGAHTGRFSGWMGLNMQNLPRKSKIRCALRAPPGHRVVVADLSSIEARITASLANERTLVDQFRANVDVYTNFACELFDIQDPAEITKEQRFVGKQCILGLGYGMGPTKFHSTMQSFGIDMDYKQAESAVALYRMTFSNIRRMWRHLDHCLEQMATLPFNDSAWQNLPSGLSGAGIQMFREKLVLPNGMPMYYPNLTTGGANGPTYEYRPRRGIVKHEGIWGGSLCENIVQALARIVVSRAEVRLAKAGLTAALQVHDELVYVVPTHTVPTVKECIRRILTDPVPWMFTLPIACEIEDADTYGDAKK